MKISTTQRNLILIVAGLVIVGLAITTLEIDDLVKASFEDERERPWKLYDITYEENMFGEYKAVGNARFYNDRLIDSVICERFDFYYKEVDGEPYNISRELNITIPYREYNSDYYTMEFDLRNIPPEGIDVRLYAIAYDENGNAHTVPEELIIPLRPPVEEESTSTPIPVETPTPEPTPGFEAVFAIAGLLAVIYLIKKE